MARTLVAYFSRAGQNYGAGGLVDLPRGNTEVLATAVAEAIGADTFEIVPAQAYPVDYYACTDVAKRELAADARPALAKALGDVSGYDVVIVAFPNWWGTAPMPVRTFLDGLDLAGVTLAPLCTNEGSGLGSSERDLAAAYPAARVAGGLAVRGHAVTEPDAQERAVAWAVGVVRAAEARGR